jgi:hypothetical protein
VFRPSKEAFLIGRSDPERKGSAAVGEDNLGNPQVTAPFGPAAVIMAETPTESCEYQVKRNLMVITTGASRRIASCSGVLCSALLGYRQ